MVAQTPWKKPRNAIYIYIYIYAAQIAAQTLKNTKKWFVGQLGDA